MFWLCSLIQFKLVFMCMAIRSFSNTICWENSLKHSVVMVRFWEITCLYIQGFYFWLLFHVSLVCNCQHHTALLAVIWAWEVWGIQFCYFLKAILVTWDPLIFRKNCRKDFSASFLYGWFIWKAELQGLNTYRAISYLLVHSLDGYNSPDWRNHSMLPDWGNRSMAHWLTQSALESPFAQMRTVKG